MGIVGHVFNKGESLNIMDAYHDERFNKDNDVKSGFKTNTILCVPILDNANHAIGVVQAINKKGSAAVFSKDDEGLLMILATLAGAVLRNSLNYDDLKVFHNNLRSSLKIGIALTSCHGYNELIPTAEKKLKALMGGEQSRIILKNADNDDLYTYKEGEIERFPAKCGIAGYAISTGEMQNIANAYTHNLFNGGIDIQTSMPLICQPFKHPGTDQIMGAFEVINVRGIPGLSMSQKPKITHYDIETLDFFSKQLAQAITNTVRWEKLVKTGKDDSCVQPAKIPDSPLHITKPL
jgi:GAF domain-containing protein